MPEPPSTLQPLIARHLPGYEVRSIELMGEGLDNVAYLVNEELVVRQARKPDADAIRREVAALEIVGRYATVPVPEVVFADAAAGVLAYRHLAGTPLMYVASGNTSAIGTILGAFLGPIHGIPMPETEGVAPREDEPLQVWLDEAISAYEDIADHLPAPARMRIDSFLKEAPPSDPERLTFCHNDFGAEHILVDPGTMRVTGIIDWTDAVIADPVRDLALILCDLGPDALCRALVVYGMHLTPADHARLVFHARCKLIEDIAYGLESGATGYVDAALAHLDWTFQTTSL